MGGRTVLAAPLLREGVAIGVILIRRTEVRPFTDKQINLLETFADQAVIAIENVRLFKELQERNAELREALEHQTATGEVLRVIASSPTELQPVLDTLIANAVKLSGATKGHVRQYDGKFLQVVAHFARRPKKSRAIAADQFRRSRNARLVPVRLSRRERSMSLTFKQKIMSLIQPVNPANGQGWQYHCCERVRQLEP